MVEVAVIAVVAVVGDVVFEASLVPCVTTVDCSCACAAWRASHFRSYALTMALALEVALSGWYDSNANRAIKGARAGARFSLDHASLTEW